MPPQNLEDRLRRLAEQTSQISDEATGFFRLTQVERRIKESAMPLTALSYFKEGIKFFEKKEYNAAIQAFKQVVRQKPDYDLAHNNLGKAYYGDGNIAAAAKHYREATRLNPYLRNAYNNLGTALYEQGATEEAKEKWKQGRHSNDWEKLLEDRGEDWIDANVPISSALITTYHKFGDFEKELEVFRLILEIPSEKPQAHNIYADVLFDVGKVDEAIEHYRKAIQLDPDFTQAHFNLGMAYESKGLFNNAMKEYKTARGLNQKDVNIQNRLSRLQEMMM